MVYRISHLIFVNDENANEVKLCETLVFSSHNLTPELFQCSLKWKDFVNVSDFTQKLNQSKMRSTVN